VDWTKVQWSLVSFQTSYRRQPGGSMRCSSCGSEHSENAKFCDSCGTPVPVRCPSCGSSN